jgi:hypothetical protein
MKTKRRKTRRKVSTGDEGSRQWLGLVAGLLLAAVMDQSPEGPERRKRASKILFSGLTKGASGHWQVFAPHCPQVCGVPCPPECPNSKEARFDGCHVCDCLHPKRTKEE